MTPVKATKHGGKREGSGRKADPLKDIRIGAATAQKILRELDHEKEIIKIYKGCDDSRLKLHTIFRLREDAFGRPGQRRDEREEPQAPIVRVLIEHITGTRAAHSPSTKAK